MENLKIKNTPKRRGMKKPYKGIKMPAISRRLAFTLFKPKRTDYLLPLKGSTYSLVLSLSIIWSYFSCSRVYFDSAQSIYSNKTRNIEYMNKNFENSSIVFTFIFLNPTLVLPAFIRLFSLLRLSHFISLIYITNFLFGHSPL